ncbi:MAG: hypothetical protein KGY45_01785 [Hadesarchaea archaeon]|nr:hypothetical protein [Hadesarchaea archaeon]
MNSFYNRKDVRRAILDFVYSGSPAPLRECAFYNEKTGGIQRHVKNDSNEDSIFVLESDSSFSQSLKAGASAFYSSYWRYNNPFKAKQEKGRDLAWTIRATEGGLPLAKNITSSFVEVLNEEGFSPLVKYSGRLGFDVLVLLEDAEERIVLDRKAIIKTQEKLTQRLSTKVSDRLNFKLSKNNSKFIFKGGSGTCLLYELSWGRGLLLAPMSLHPSSGLVSTPVPPTKIKEFSARNASPEGPFPHKWNLSSRIQKLSTPPELVPAVNHPPVRV